MTDSSRFSNQSIRAERAFDELIGQVQRCRACPTMAGRRRVLTRANGGTHARIMLVGEAPGRFGAERTGIPFSGDQSGRRLDSLLDAAGWRRGDVFLTNAVLCNPQGSSGKNRPPSAAEASTCCLWLAAQIALIDPLLVVALGRIALRSLGQVEYHGMTLQDVGIEPACWGDRRLAVAYHPGPRAAIHRPIQRQLEDFRQLGVWLSGFSGGSDASR
jgi:uracil-DNA glycosylase family 4